MQYHLKDEHVYSCKKKKKNAQNESFTYKMKITRWFLFSAKQTMYDSDKVHQNSNQIVEKSREFHAILEYNESIIKK